MKIQAKKASERRKILCIIESGQKPVRNLGGDVVIAEIGHQISFDPATLDELAVNGCQPAHYDLLVICAAIEFADRRWKRSAKWERDLQVAIPVIDLVTWRRPEVLKRLTAVLKHLTGDSWSFTFIQANNRSPIEFRQASLDLGEAKTFAVAYSDGLDSRAVSALSGNKDEALCVRIANKKQHPKLGDSYFTQIPFKVDGFRSNESSFRSRGFQFASITAIAAHLKGVTRIVVPESGQGALGPVLLPFYKIYPDFRNHPAFFRKMEAFVMEALGHKVGFEQPRIWSTKGKTLSDFMRLPGKSKEELMDTRSCWQTRWVVNVDGERKQCGLCAACMLRRLSLHAAGVEEEPEAYVVWELGAPSLDKALSGISRAVDRRIMTEYGMAGVRHLQDLADMARQPDEELHGHASEISTAIGEDYKVTLRNLRALLSAHAEEWREFLVRQGGDSFLMGWLEGGRYG